MTGEMSERVERVERVAACAACALVGVGVGLFYAALGSTPLRGPPLPALPGETTVAMDIGDVFGAAEACGMTLNRDAIARYVAANLPAGAVGFGRQLETWTSIAQRNYADMPPDRLAISCAAARRAAAGNGFTK